MEQQNNTMALVSMVLGIASIVLSCCCCIGVVPAGLAVIFACLSRVEEHFTSQAKTGLITGMIGLVMAPVMGLILIVMLGLGSGNAWY